MTTPLSHKTISLQHAEALSLFFKTTAATIRWVNEFVFHESFEGDIRDLQDYLGFHHFCRAFGWRVALLVNTKKRIKHFESFTKCRLRDRYPALTSDSYRSVGLRNALQTGNYWKCVSGDYKIEGRYLIEKAQSEHSQSQPA